ncbi:hypothetical protein J4480_05065 [Candidatus Woesearchaeota archaeon]|nr:hypothetical protein [Candidatus Woesearchaeota archaeon]
MYVKILKRIAGFALVGLGIIGIFVPILQGILLILAGLFLLEIKVEDIKKWIKKLKF